MTEPTKEQVEAWQREAEAFVSELGAGAGWPDSYDAYLVRRAAAWAREQALEEAARLCRDVHGTASLAAKKLDDAIRALKGKK